MLELLYFDSHETLEYYDHHQLHSTITDKNKIYFLWKYNTRIVVMYDWKVSLLELVLFVITSWSASLLEGLLS